ncbi:threonine/serine exporter ThrE family protein [Nonomuraea sp. NPDC050556]|uniref:threonine/serine exporter ThrE family protein n=1 Tax=Nonomuraea sp. NPDC050556 TaxID=3364369 RepID=UPI0037B8F5F6
MRIVRLLRKVLGRLLSGRSSGDQVTLLPEAEKESMWTRRLAALLCELGSALLQAGETTEQVTDTLRDVAARYGVRARSFVVPTGLFVRVGDWGDEVVDFLPVDNAQLRLDQVQALYALVSRARADEIPIEDVRAELKTVREMPSRVSPVASIGGYMVLTVGLGLLQHPTWQAVAGWAVLGVGVGVLRLLGLRFPVLATAMPVVAAAAVTVVSLQWAGPLLHMPPEELLIPPLIAFLPGSALTMGTMELAKGNMLAGVGRLASGVNVLLLLAFGILVGSSIATVHTALDGASRNQVLVGWAPWAGVLLLGVGFLVFYSAQPKVLPWLVACLMIERAAQLAGTAMAGTAFGAFAAGLAIPLISAFVERRTTTPAQVLFLPSFWMLVPGSVGLTGVSELVTGQGSGAGDLLQTVIIVLAITLGILVGASLLPMTRVEVESVTE